MTSRRVKLAYVVNSLNPGGTEKLVAEMGIAFAKEFDVSVLCLDAPGLWAEHLRARGIAVHCLWRQPGLDLGVALRLASYFRRHGTHIVHAHQCTPWFYSALARLMCPWPRLLFEEHGRFYPEVPKPLRALVQRLLIRRLTHRFVAVSEDIRARLRRYEGLEAAFIEVIYNGVRPEVSLDADARRALRAQFGFDEQCFVVGTVGRFDPIKNLPLLVEGLALARARVTNLRGLLIGDGPVFDEIDALVGRRGLRAQVRLTGFRDDARRLVQCMDLFVLASLSEGTSVALLEAMAAGVPVVVTDVGGNPEIVSHGVTGWVVPSGAEAALAAAVEEAATDADKRRTVAAAARRRVAQHFSFETMIRSYRERYQALLAHASPAWRARMSAE